MASWLENNGLQISDADPCLFLNKEVILFVWVDDIVLMGPGKDKLIEMMKKQFKIKDLGRAQHVLGMKISHCPGAASE